MKTKKIPTKQELLHLQKLYRTDKRIGQALGNVPEQLVGYWRRKKGIGKSVFPKYSEREIKDLWERHGDDLKAGQELGVTKQAFYRWRKKYQLFDRPAILRLEQLELKFFDEQRLNRAGERQLPAQTFLQKIASFRNGNQLVPIGKQASLPVDLVVTIDGDGVAVISPFGSGSRRKHEPETARFDSLVAMFDAGYFRPGQIIVTDRVEAMALAVTSSYVAIVPSSAEIIKQPPESIEMELAPTLKVILAGATPLRQNPFDSACRIKEAVAGAIDQPFIIELSGAGAEGLALEDRMTLLTLTSLLTERHVVIEPDQTFLNYMQHYGKTDRPVPFSDKNAPFLDEVSVAMGKTRSALYSLRRRAFVTDAQEFSSRKLKRIRIGPLLGGNLDDFKVIAQAIGSDFPRRGIELYMIPSSRFVFTEALRKRFVHVIVEACGRVGNVCSSPPLLPLADDEYELTTELDPGRGDSYLASIKTIAQALESGKISKRLFETA